MKWMLETPSSEEVHFAFGLIVGWCFCLTFNALYQWWRRGVAANRIIARSAMMPDQGTESFEEWVKGMETLFREYQMLYHANDFPEYVSEFRDSSNIKQYLRVAAIVARSQAR